MLLMPNEHWCWQYNKTYDVLSIKLGKELEFLTPYTAKILIPDALNDTLFDIKHMQFYTDLVERLQKTLSLSDPQLVQLALNATAAHFLLQPQMPKSWYFDVSNECVFTEIGKCFELQSQGEQAEAIVIETNLQSSVMILLANKLELTETKSLKQFDVIKVMHNRLHPLRTKVKRQQVVAA